MLLRNDYTTDPFLARSVGVWPALAYAANGNRRKRVALPGTR